MAKAVMATGYSTVGIALIRWSTLTLPKPLSTRLWRARMGSGCIGNALNCNIEPSPMAAVWNISTAGANGVALVAIPRKSAYRKGREVALSESAELRDAARELVNLALAPVCLQDHEWARSLKAAAEALEAKL
jgi:hypothetical protein